jgi:hypothetical protein
MPRRPRQIDNIAMRLTNDGKEIIRHASMLPPYMETAE